MTQPQRPYGPGSSNPAPGQQPYVGQPYTAPTYPAPSPAPAAYPPHNPPGPGRQGPAVGVPSAPSARQPARRRRSIAWIYYSIIAVVSVFAAISTGKPQVLIATALCTAYAIYLYRGGRFVLWIW